MIFEKHPTDVLTGVRSGGTLVTCAASATGGDEMAPSGSPTVRRRRLAAELRKLRGNRTGGEVARGVGWSATKVSRAESGRESLPSAEIEKLIDFYGVTEPLRSRLLALAEDALQRGWWDDYADVLNPHYLEFIGLEAEAVSCLQWQADVIPGLLQTEEYARQINLAFRSVDPTIPPSAQERFLQVRIRRQARLVQVPALELAVVMDEAVLLRGLGGREVMRVQLTHLANVSDLPNVDLRILPLNQNAGLHGSPFTVMSFGPRGVAGAELGDVVSVETLDTALYVEGEAGTYRYRMFFEALSKAALPSAESRSFIISTMDRAWS